MAELRKMRTAEEMNEYYREIKKDTTTGLLSFSDRLFIDALNEYKIAEEFLEKDEYCLTTFRVYVYIYKHIQETEEWIYILTNKRIITINFEQEGSESIGWNQIERFIIRNRRFIIETDTYNRSLSCVFVKTDRESEIIEKELEKVMPFIWKEREKMLQERKRFLSPADEIRKFKQLWDDGIITAEEFQQKKKKLLDL